VNVVVNGETQALSEGTTIADIVTGLGTGAELGVAVALNGEVVAKSSWGRATLTEGDHIEVLRAIGGG
jgi:thiamine biosynthesis protein ThiS